MRIFFFLSCPLHPISPSCAEVFHESTNQTQSLRTPSLPGVTSSCVLGKRFFPHLGMCIIQRNHQGTPAYLPCKLHLKVSLVGLGTLIHVGLTCKCSWEENNLKNFCHPMCWDGWSSHEQTSALLQFLEGHWKAKWDWWGFTLKYHTVKFSAAVQQLLHLPGRGWMEDSASPSPKTPSPLCESGHRKIYKSQI